MPRPLSAQARNDTRTRLPRPPARAWAVLGASMAVNLVIQVLWIGYAPISSVAESFYGVSVGAVGAFSIIFMVAFVPCSLPASWVIDNRGIRVAVGGGALIAGAAGIGRGVVGDSWLLAFALTTVIAIAQPLLLNSWTATVTPWFPPRLHATAVGCISLSGMLGAGVGLTLSPDLSASLGVAGMQLAYGIAMAVVAVVFILVVRDVPPGFDAGRRPVAGLFDLSGVRQMIAVRRYPRFLAVVFVVFGVVNGLTTWIEQIVLPHGLSQDEAGLLGVAVLTGGVIGSIVLPAASDRLGRRIPFIRAGLAVSSVALVGLALFSTLELLLAAGVVVGFSLISLIPLGLQYGAEIVAPAPESAATGFIQICGQAAVVFVIAMGLMQELTGSMTAAIIVLAALLLLSAIVLRGQPESRPGVTGPATNELPRKVLPDTSAA